MANDLVPTNPNNDLPDYLKGTEQVDLGGLDSSDFKIPRVKLLQALSPEIRAFPGVAMVGNFWHDVANKSLGDKFNMVVAKPSKRVILWAPRKTMGGGMLAFSADGKYWASGGNSSFDITLEGKRVVKWSTGKDVAASRLLDWGSSDPENEKSPPAATLIYEYMCYLPDHPDLSPCVIGLYRTAVANAKKLNTELMAARKPLPSMIIECTAKEEQSDGNVWMVPSFRRNGFATKQVYDIATNLATQYAAYTASYTPEEVSAPAANSGGAKVVPKDDEIPF